MTKPYSDMDLITLQRRFDPTPPSIPPVSLGSGCFGFPHSWLFRIPLVPIRQVDLPGFFGPLNS